jgi:hypothetical protein
MKKKEKIKIVFEGIKKIIDVINVSNFFIELFKLIVEFFK